MQGWKKLLSFASAPIAVSLTFPWMERSLARFAARCAPDVRLVVSEEVADAHLRGRTHPTFRRVKNRVCPYFYAATFCAFCPAKADSSSSRLLRAVTMFFALMWP